MVGPGICEGQCYTSNISGWSIPVFVRVNVTLGIFQVGWYRYLWGSILNEECFRLVDLGVCVMVDDTQGMFPGRLVSHKLWYKFFYCSVQVSVRVEAIEEYFRLVGTQYLWGFNATGGMFPVGWSRYLWGSILHKDCFLVFDRADATRGKFSDCSI